VTKAVALALAVVVHGCGSTATARARGPQADYEVRASRVGQSLHLDITGVLLSRRARSAFEDPTKWWIDVRAERQRLRRLVNGSVRIARDPVGRDDWRISVDFSVAFALPTATERVTVGLRPPGQPRVELALDVADL
jgi:hypothetical protein